MVRLSQLNCKDTLFYYLDLLDEKNSSDQFIVTHGVLEHFTDKQIESILIRYPNSIHYVPLDKYKKQSYGDERLLPKEYWKNRFMIKKSFTFNDGHDFCFESNY